MAAGRCTSCCLTLSIAHIRWTLISVTIASLIVFCAAAFIARRQSPTREPQPTQAALARPRHALHDRLLRALRHARALWEWDFWAIWGLKARTFLEIGGIDWRFLESRWNTFAHHRLSAARAAELRLRGAAERRMERSLARTARRRVGRRAGARRALARGARDDAVLRLAADDRWSRRSASAATSAWRKERSSPSAAPAFSSSAPRCSMTTTPPGATAR